MSFFGGDPSEPNPLPRCPVCNFVRMLPHEQRVGMCEGCAEGRKIELDPLEKQAELALEHAPANRK